jgi:hypothetical protein
VRRNDRDSVARTKLNGQSVYLSGALTIYHKVAIL